MGDRALIVFHDDDGEVSPTVYLHWNGEDVQNMLEAALPRMRKGDVSYSCARFIGECHARLNGNTSLGVFNTTVPLEGCKQSDFSPGDAGVFLVDVNTWRVEAFNGYGFAHGEMSLQLDAAQVSH